MAADTDDVADVTDGTELTGGADDLSEDATDDDDGYECWYFD